MPKSSMIAEYLRRYAHWRLDRAEESDDGRNARSAVALIDAAAYAGELDDSARVLERMTDAGCFGNGGFRPGAEGERIIRGWRYGAPAQTRTDDPAELLEAVAAAAELERERELERQRQRDSCREGDRVSAKTKAKAKAGTRSRAKSRSRRR